MDDHKEREYWLRLIHWHGRSPDAWCNCLRARWPGRSIADLTTTSPDAAAFLDTMLRAAPEPDRDWLAADLRWLAGAPNRRLLPISDPRYPSLLREIPDPPPALFVSGDPRHLDIPCLAIVGSRNCTPQGRETAATFARALAAAGLAVASGLARGIDGCAHRGALETGVTVGVCAHGLDIVYPRAHQRLAAVIAEKGVLISEFPTGTPPRPNHFPRRNRLISGLSLGTLVVEAGLKSGSLITARLAGEQGREVFAVPGPISAPQSKGCHILIKNGAVLVESLDDVLREIDHFNEGRNTPPCSRAREADTEYSWFLDYMGYAPCTRDQLVKRSGLTAAQVSSMLLALELEGCVELCPGGTYVRVSTS